MVTTLRGLEMVSSVNKGGDTGLKLEKFLLAWAETRAPRYLDQVLVIVDKPNKARSASYQMVILHTDVLREKMAAVAAPMQYEQVEEMAEVPAESAGKPIDVDQSVAALEPVINAHPEATEQSFKRDREHTTILINGLPSGVTRERLEAFFTDFFREMMTCLQLPW
ncbi:uncharacterized protein IL334_004982 [Kwoniella shivajii]|uniref:RRM domain-containing protein n=1 Tax=Kwoniella shivajii TaxID=564305 RepID=A0ABZ1D5U0_9TREE|nr:hypothetical protein IL334_004982 [Kwoniella shivajii]